MMHRHIHRTRIALASFALVVFHANAVAQPSPSRRAFDIDIAPGNSLLSDERGTYRDQRDRVLAFGLYAITLCTDQRTCTTLPDSIPADRSSRELILNLEAPVAGSGAVSRGKIRSSAANFGAFWGQDTMRRTTYGNRDGWVIRSALDIPLGATITSERVEIRFFNDGEQHILQFGPWTAGQYQPNQGRITGEGTTAATITHSSDSLWVVRSGPSSVGRLWNNREPRNPVDLGLYHFSFDVRYRKRER